MLLNWIKKALAPKSTKSTDVAKLSYMPWGQRIADAEARGEFTDEDRKRPWNQ